MTLLSRLKACVSDEGEIEPLVSIAAGGGTRFSKSGAVEYVSADPRQTVFATLRQKDGRITQFIPGPGLRSQSAQDAFVEQARAHTAHTHGTFVSSRVLFAERPLRGRYCWGDKLRISPCPRGARIGKGLDWTANQRLPHEAGSHLGPPFPFLLEVRTFRSPNSFLETNRTLRDLDTYQYLLTLLLHGRVRYVHHPAERQWISVKRRTKIEYHLLYAGFDAGGPGRTDDFARRRMKSAPIYAGADYYNHLWGQDEELYLPDTLASDLTICHGLPKETARRLNRACYWYSLGVQMTAEPSLSTVAFATAIECLLPRPSAIACTTCGKPSGLGPTKLFNQHLKRYGIVPTALESRRNAIYGVRSALVHGSHAERADDNFFSSARSFVDRLLLETVTQRSLIGWLRDPRRPV